MLDTNVRAQALTLIAQHEENASLAALLIADDEMDSGNTRAFREWLQVAAEVRNLERHRKPT